MSNDGFCIKNEDDFTVESRLWCATAAAVPAYVAGDAPDRGECHADECHGAAARRNPHHNVISRAGPDRLFVRSGVGAGR